MIGCSFWRPFKTQHGLSCNMRTSQAEPGMESQGPPNSRRNRSQSTEREAELVKQWSHVSKCPCMEVHLANPFPKDTFVDVKRAFADFHAWKNALERDGAGTNHMYLDSIELVGALSIINPLAKKIIPPTQAGKSKRPWVCVKINGFQQKRVVSC